MTENFKTMIITFIILGLFMLSLFNFINITQSDNDVTNSLANDPDTASIINSLTENLTAFKEIAEDQRSSFERENPIAGFGELIFTSITGIGKIIGSVVINFYDILSTSALIIGIPPIVLNVISGIIIFTIVFLAWRLYRVGD